jgi:hypothetical protein
MDEGAIAVQFRPTREMRTPRRSRVLVTIVVRT